MPPTKTTPASGWVASSIQPGKMTASFSRTVGRKCASIAVKSLLRDANIICRPRPSSNLILLPTPNRQ